ncbi:hypothetical protein SNEBB_003498 [Seison nebaliae]|nr:hypothetical protein SNEBB_003498 [Seison nebaliae]
MTKNCSMEAKKPLSSRICRNGDFDEDFSMSYPEWNNRISIVKHLNDHMQSLCYRQDCYLFGHHNIIRLLTLFNVIYREIYPNQGHTILLQYTWVRIRTILLQMDMTQVKYVPLIKIIGEKYVDCFHNINSTERKNRKMLLQDILWNNCLSTQQQEHILYIFFAEEQVKVLRWVGQEHFKDDQNTFDHDFVMKTIQILMQTLMFQEMEKVVSKLVHYMKITTKTKYQENSYLAANLLLRYYVQSWSWSRLLDENVDMKKLYESEMKSKVILECYFNHRNCKENEIKKVSGENGICYQIKPQSNTTTSSLEVIDAFGYDSKKTISVTIQSEDRLPSMMDTPLSINSGTSTTINLIPYERNLLMESADGFCQPATKELKQKYNLMEQYSYSQCIQECLHQFIVNDCSCQLYDDIIKRPGKFYCTTSASIYCMRIALKTFDWRKHCKFCPNECHMVGYEKQIFSKFGIHLKYRESYSNCYSNRMLNNLSENDMRDDSFRYSSVCLTPANFKNAATSIKFNFHRLLHNSTQKSELNSYTKISQFGGIIILFTSISCITMMEFVAYVLGKFGCCDRSVSKNKL